MDLHEQILAPFLKLGYTKTGGCCRGFAMLWLEACLLGEEHLFNKRIEKIVSTDGELFHAILAVKAKKGKNVTAEDKSFLDILAFYDRLELYQTPWEHSALFHTFSSVRQDDIEIISSFASSDAIISPGGLVSIYSEPSIPSKKELKRYLDELRVVLKKTYSSSSKERVGMVLSSFDHTIAITYEPNKGWRLMDINRYPPQEFKINKTDSLAKKIFASFNLSNNPFSAFNIFLVTSGNNSCLSELKKICSHLRSVMKSLRKLLLA